MDSAKFGIERLNGFNYALWSKKLVSYLKYKGLLCPMSLLLAPKAAVPLDL
jgi:hypothetical protein